MNYKRTEDTSNVNQQNSNVVSSRFNVKHFSDVTNDDWLGLRRLIKQSILIKSHKTITQKNDGKNRSRRHLFLGCTFFGCLGTNESRKDSS